MADYSNVLKGYTPEPPKDEGFPALKGNFVAKVNHARLEDYEGDNPDFFGVKFFKYELEVVGPNSVGRRLWGSYNMANETKVKKLYDNLFAIGMDFMNDEELLDCAVKMTTPGFLVKVNAWGFTFDKDMNGQEIPEDQRKEVQFHAFKGLAKDDGVSKEPAF